MPRPWHGEPDLDLPLSPEVFAILSALIEERLGLVYRADDRELLRARLAPRAAEAGFASLLDYYYFLRYDPRASEELDTLADALLVNESYLFREFKQLRFIVDEVLAPRVALGERPRLWSAACASGEEPFTIAMLLAERGILGKVEIVASDLSQRCLARARAGELGRRAIRDVPDPALVERWVETKTDDRHGAHVVPEIRGAVDFRRINLLDDEAVARLGTFDAIVCRNVLIYFSDRTTRQVVARLVARLRPQGSLWVGVSESLMRLGTSLVCEERGGIFFYRQATG